MNRVIFLILFLTPLGCSRALMEPQAEPIPKPIERAGKVRTDGIYSCRNIEVVGSAGGLVWPLVTSRTVDHIAEFLKFNEDGTVSEIGAMEPVQMEIVKSSFALKASDENGPSLGMYVVNAEGLFFILKGKSPLGFRFSPVFHADVGDNRLIIRDRSIIGKNGPHEYFFEPLK